MRYRRLGTSDLEVSAVSMGCWAIVGDDLWGPQDEGEALAAIRAALDAGINFFDTAEGYGRGRSEQLVAKGLEKRRKDVFIATKVSPDHLRPEDLEKACERSLRNLRRDVIDLYQIHWPNWDVPIAETMGALTRLKQQGKIRWIGVSNFGPRDLADALEAGEVVSNQVPYNLLWRAIEYEAQPLCVEKKVGILCYCPLFQGLLTGKFATAEEMPPGRARARIFSGERPLSRHGGSGCEKEAFAALAEIRRIVHSLGAPMADAAIAWLLHQAGVASVIAGARNPAQVAENAKAADLDLPRSVVEELNDVTSRVKEFVGANPDMWAKETRYR